MQNLLKTLILTTLIGTATPAFAGGYDFETTLPKPINVALDIDVEIGEDLAYRADHLPKKMRDRNTSRFNAAFANNGFYGQKDLDQLEERLETKLEQAFAKKGLEVADDAMLTLKVTLQDAKPNRPTMAQMRRDTTLGFHSFGLGGAEIDGVLVDIEGNIVGKMAYKYYENDIRDAQYGGTWSDANRAVARFATKTANHLAATN